FGVQVFTGILLLLYYRPSATEAYESVQFIVTQVPFGWLIRNVHSWSANLLIGLAFAHFFSVFFLKSYRKPRELTWVSGMLLLFVQRQGMSVPPGVEQKLQRGERLPQMPFFPNYILRDVLAWYVVIAVVAALAAFYPWELGTKADPFAVVPPGIRPEWYFLAMFHTLKLVPSHVLGFEGERLGVVAFGIAALFPRARPVPRPRSSGGG